MFEIPKGAKVWVLGDASPILELSDGSVVWQENLKYQFHQKLLHVQNPQLRGILNFGKNPTPDRAVEPKA